MLYGLRSVGFHSAPIAAFALSLSILPATAFAHHNQCHSSCQEYGATYCECVDVSAPMPPPIDLPGPVVLPWPDLPPGDGGLPGRNELPHKPVPLGATCALISLDGSEFNFQSRFGEDEGETEEEKAEQQRRVDDIIARLPKNPGRDCNRWIDYLEYYLVLFEREYDEWDVPNDLEPMEAVQWILDNVPRDLAMRGASYAAAMNAMSEKFTLCFERKLNRNGLLLDWDETNISRLVVCRAEGTE